MASKLRLVFSISILFLSFYGTAQRDYWKQQSSKTKTQNKIYNDFEVKKGKFFSFNEKLFKESLQSLRYSKSDSRIIQIPNEKGEVATFSVVENPVFSEELSEKYPSIKSYSGYSLKNKNDRIRFSISHKGIQAMIVYAGKKKNVFLQKIGDGQYVVYNRDNENFANKEFICSTSDLIAKQYSALTSKPGDDQILRKFRLAISATGEYTNFHGGSVVDALAAINATVTRVNQLFETDLGVTLELVADNDKIIYVDGENDPYDGNLNSQVQGIMNDSIGATNYDVGHLFHKVPSVSENGGNAGFIGAVCIDSRKGSGYSAKFNPIGDTYDLDYVAHEMGHQFGANHTWSFESEGTQVQVEPGSGTTIMGYAGITGVNNVAPFGDDYFHYFSIFQISEYLSSVTCAEEIPLTNSPPFITPSSDYIIPKSTAFALNGIATDVDSVDILTYAWEQIDDGVVTQASFGPTNPSGANFRSQKPTTDPTRYFPSLSKVMTGNLTQTVPPVNSDWETVSDVEREMNFALTVRDNAVGGGQVVTDLMKVSVVNDAGPFLVTSQSVAQVYTAGTVQNITWDVANTNRAPVSATSVDILLSADGGMTFPITLAEDIINDGNHKVVLPGNPTTTARIMVKAHDNVFFAVNSVEFTIEASEIVLNFPELEFDICQPDDLVTTFDYETYLEFDEEVTFSVPNLPSGSSVLFSPMTATADTLVTMTLSDTGALPESLYAIEVMAMSTSITKKVTLDANVFDSVFPDVTLIAPADNGVEISAKTFLEWEDSSSYQSYIVEISNDITFNTIVESVAVFNNTYAPTSLNNETTYYWRVKPLNACGEGTFSTPFSFTTIEFNCMSNAAAGLPISISSSGTPTIISKIPFYEDLALADINVNIELDHTYLADLVIKLISPSGTTVVLLSSSCGEFDNINAIFDDDAPSFTCSGDPVISGMVKPLGSLNSFEGESILGEWILEINDNEASDGGSLKSFSLDICIEGDFRPDVDQDGVFDDGDDLCLGTPEGVEVDLFGCQVHRFDNDNFAVSLNSETCRDNNDGSIDISANTAIDYSIDITGLGVEVNDSFTDIYSLGSLISGAYEVCISGTDGTIDYEEHCFEVVITQPDVLDVGSKTSMEGMHTVLTLQGSDLYNIEINGEVIQTTEEEITISLKNGNNTLKVFTNLPCQGVYEENIFISESVLVYPNPFENVINIYIGHHLTECSVELFTSEGRIVFRRLYEVNGDSFEMNLSLVPSGIYYLKYEGVNFKGISKIIKR